MPQDTFRFGQPHVLGLLPMLGVLAFFWGVRLVQRRRAVRRLRCARVLPVPERFRFAGPLAFQGCLLVSVASLALALALPQRLMVSDMMPIDLVVILDGSASVRVADVTPSRWQRSIQFLRTLVEALPWKGDRMGLAVFANHALPQIRLVRDPNTVLFFLEHLRNEPPFALEENTSWDTNAYEGIRWSLKLVAKDEEYAGTKGNPKSFILLSDGDRFSGETTAAIAEARNLGIPIHVVGVGTAAGGLIPLPKPLEKSGASDSYWQQRAVQELEKKREGIPAERINSAIDRDSLRRIASLAGGRYFELDAEPDAAIASRIVADVRTLRSSPAGPVFVDLYWQFLLASVLIFAVGVITLR